MNIAALFSSRINVHKAAYHLFELEMIYRVSHDETRYEEFADKVRWTEVAATRSMGIKYAHARQSNYPSNHLIQAA